MSEPKTPTTSPINITVRVVYEYVVNGIRQHQTDWVSSDSWTSLVQRLQPNIQSIVSITISDTNPTSVMARRRKYVGRLPKNNEPTKGRSNEQVGSPQVQQASTDVRAACSDHAPDSTVPNLWDTPTSNTPT